MLPILYTPVTVSGAAAMLEFHLQGRSRTGISFLASPSQCPSWTALCVAATLKCLQQLQGERVLHAFYSADHGGYTALWYLQPTLSNSAGALRLAEACLQYHSCKYREVTSSFTGLARTIVHSSAQISVLTIQLP